jgi:hypothetical protein
LYLLMAWYTNILLIPSVWRVLKIAFNSIYGQTKYT